MALYTGPTAAVISTGVASSCAVRCPRGERRSKMKKAIAAGVMAAAALVFAVPAQAAPEGIFLGSETVENGAAQQFMWSVTGCGDGCVTVHALPNGWTQNFTFDGANWVGHL